MNKLRWFQLVCYASAVAAFSAQNGLISDSPLSAP